jgi:hypothetical protein
VTLPSVFGCQVCSTLEKQNVPKSKVFFGAKCASANLTKMPQNDQKNNLVPNDLQIPLQ